jgi:hypothetical protein
VKQKGYRAAYAPQVSLNETDKIKAIREAFATEDIILAEVGYWENLIDLEPKERARHRQAMVDALALAEELGARCAVDIFGSYCYGNGNSKHSAWNFSAQAFEEAVDMARYFIDEVKPKNAFFCFEIFPFSVVDSPEATENELVDWSWQWGSPHFRAEEINEGVYLSPEVAPFDYDMLTQYQDREAFEKQGVYKPEKALPKFVIDATTNQRISDIRTPMKSFIDATFRSIIYCRVNEDNGTSSCSK